MRPSFFYGIVIGILAFILLGLSRRGALPSLHASPALLAWRDPLAARGPLRLDPFPGRAGDRALCAAATVCISALAKGGDAP